LWILGRGGDSGGFLVRLGRGGGGEDGRGGGVFRVILGGGVDGRGGTAT